MYKKDRIEKLMQRIWNGHSLNETHKKGIQGPLLRIQTLAELFCVSGLSEAPL